MSATSSNAVPRIQVVSVTKRFKRQAGAGEVVPLDNVSVDIAPEEMLVLLGPSGCGKTTLLRCIAGLEEPNEGEIYINGELVFSASKGIFLPPNKRTVSMVFQSYALWPHMTLYENVAYPLRSRNVGRDETDRRTREALEVVGLLPLANQHPGQISGGQQQRVALARAVVSQTGIVLFDEPLSNVDAKVREQLRLEIRRMQRHYGFSAVYVTHDQSEAMAVSDRIAVLGNGRIEQLGTAAEVYDFPASSYVGSFIGLANMWKGTAFSTGSGTTIGMKTSIGDLVADAGTSIGTNGFRPSAGEEALVLVRPEAVEITHQEVAGRLNQMACVVETRVFLGSHTEYVLTVGTQKVRAWVPGNAPFAEAGNAWIGIDPVRIRLLRADAAFAEGAHQ